MQTLLTKRFKGLSFTFLSILCLMPGIPSPAALAAGLVFGLIIGCPVPLFLNKWTKTLLRICVVGLGFGMPIADIFHSGKDGIFFSFFSIALSLVLGTLFSNVLKVTTNSGILITVGTAICGGSAIAAVAPVIRAEPDDMTVSLGAIFTLNALALFLFPWIGQLLDMSAEQFGLWSALAIHDISSVVGASSLFGTQALAIATTVKLARALWILPLVLFFGLYTGVKGKITMQWFIFFFIAAALLNTLLPEFQRVFFILSGASKQAFCLVLFWIGCSMNKNSLKKVGFRPLVLAIVLWITQASISLAYLMS